MSGSTVHSLRPASVAAAPEPRARRLTIVRGDAAADPAPAALHARRRSCHLACERAPDGAVVFVGHTSDGRTPVRCVVDLAHDDWLDVAGRVADLLDIYEATPGITLAKGASAR